MLKLRQFLIAEALVKGLSDIKSETALKAILIAFGQIGLSKEVSDIIVKRLKQSGKDATIDFLKECYYEQKKISS